MTLVAQLLIISVVGYMVQSAALSSDICKIKQDILLKKAKTRSDLENKKIHLYCVAKSLHDTIKKFTDAKLHTTPINGNTKTMLNKTLNHFSNHCQQFTLALSIKYQLQDRIFNKTNMAAISQCNKSLYSILVYLETMGSILDDIEFSKHGNRCVRLTASQYKMMYHVRYDDDLLFNALKKDMLKWAHRDYFKDGTPSPCNCELFYPSLKQE